MYKVILIVAAACALAGQAQARDTRLLLSVDGQEDRTVEQGDRLEIRKAAAAVQLVHLPDRRIVASQRFAARQAITGRGMPATIEAFGQALDSVLTQLAPWVVAQGQRHWEHRLERSEAAPQDATPAH